MLAYVRKRHLSAFEVTVEVALDPALPIGAMQGHAFSIEDAEIVCLSDALDVP